MLMPGRFYQWNAACPTSAEFGERTDASFSAGGQDDPRLQRAEFLVRNPLEGVPHLVLRQAHESPPRPRVFDGDPKCHLGDLGDGGVNVLPTQQVMPEPVQLSADLLGEVERGAHQPGLILPGDYALV